MREITKNTVAFLCFFFVCCCIAVSASAVASEVDEYLKTQYVAEFNRLLFPYKDSMEFYRNGDLYFAVAPERVLREENSLKKNTSRVGGLGACVFYLIGERFYQVESRPTSLSGGGLVPWDAFSSFDLGNGETLDSPYVVQTRQGEVRRKRGDWKYSARLTKGIFLLFLDGEVIELQKVTDTHQLAILRNFLFVPFFQKWKGVIIDGGQNDYYFFEILHSNLVAGWTRFFIGKPGAMKEYSVKSIVQGEGSIYVDFFDHDEIVFDSKEKYQKSATAAEIIDLFGSNIARENTLEQYWNNNTVLTLYFRQPGKLLLDNLGKIQQQESFSTGQLDVMPKIERQEDSMAEPFVQISSPAPHTYIPSSPSRLPRLPDSRDSKTIGQPSVKATPAKKALVKIEHIPEIHDKKKPTAVQGQAELPQLHRALEQKQGREATHLINDGADINQADAQGFTPLMYAARTGDSEMLHLLIGRGAEINTASFFGKTPLSEAIIHGHRNGVDLLIESGADLDPFLYRGKVSRQGPGATLLSHSKIRKTRFQAGRALQMSRAFQPPSGTRGEPGMVEAEMMTATPLEVALGADRDAIFVHLLNTYYDDGSRKAAIDDALRSAILLKNVQLESIALLLEKQADVNGRGFDGSTPLMHAVSSGKNTLIPLLLDAGAEVNAVNAHGRTPLLHAVRRGNPETVALLLDHGALTTPLPYEKKQARSVNRAVITKGKSGVGKSVVASESARMNVANDSGSSTIQAHTADPYPFAVRHNMSQYGGHEQVALLLLEHSTPQQAQIHSTFPQVLKNGWLTLADKLIEYGADVNMELVDGVPLLNGLVGHHSSGWKQKEKTLIYLLERGAEVNRTDSIKTGYMPLHYAVKRGDVTMAEQLLQYGGDIDGLSRPRGNTGTNQQGRAPLLVACENNRREMIAFLLEQGADIASVNTANKPPLFYSRILEDPQTVALLLTHDADPNVVNALGHTPLFSAVGNNRNIETIRLLLQHGADPNHLVEKTGARYPDNLLTPLKQAVKAGNLDAAKLLVEHGADIRAESMQGMVVGAMNRKKDELVRFLILSGAELNEVTGCSTKRGYSPLMYAAELGNTEYLQLLLENGAQTEFVNKAGNTALIMAANLGDMPTVSLLLEHGANPSTMNKEGLSPYWLAKRKRHEEVADYLAANGADTVPYTDFIARVNTLKANGILPADMDIKEIAPREFEFYLALLRKQGIAEPENYQPDPRLANPEMTWALHKKALQSNDLELFKKTLIRSDHPLVEFFKQMPAERRQKLAGDMRPIEQITLERDRAKYRIKREREGQDITFYIYFVRALGEWKIQDY